MDFVFGVIILDCLGENRLGKREEVTDRRGRPVRRRFSGGHGPVVTEPLLATIGT